MYILGYQTDKLRMNEEGNNFANCVAAFSKRESVTTGTIIKTMTNNKKITNNTIIVLMMLLHSVSKKEHIV